MFARLLLFFALFLTSPALAGEAPAPLVLEGGRVITVDEAKAYFDSGKTLFIDVRNPLNFGRGHIPSAIAAPFDGSSQDAGEKKLFLNRLPRDRDAAIVFYSHGETGWKSYRAATAAIRAGYRNVMWMRSGLHGWESKGYAVSIGPGMNQR